MINLDHTDIVVTHACPNKCPFCVDKFVHTSDTLVDPLSVERFMKRLKASGCEPGFEVLFLGGDPAAAPLEHLEELVRIVRAYGFSPIISTNHPDRSLYGKLTELFDWTQITIRTDNQLQYLKQWAPKVNIKLAVDRTLKYEKLMWFIEASKAFPRRSVSMYFTPDFKELCTDPDIWELMSTLDWKINGSYLYAFYEGVRFKRCIPGVTNIADEPSVPKLYPNGNYNKTWCNEDDDPYLGKLIDQSRGYEDLVIGLSPYMLQWYYSTRELIQSLREARDPSGMVSFGWLYAKEEDIKEVLKTREHIPNKEERTKLRKEKYGRK